MNVNAQFVEFSSNSDLSPNLPATNRDLSQQKKIRPRHAAWGAFQAGMQVLQSYAGRSPANPEEIAKANLQLLHQSLLKDPTYLASLKTAFNKLASNTLLSTHCIFNDKGLRADLITLKPGTTIQLKSRDNRCAMYLAITGKPSIKPTNSTTTPNKHWWNRYRQLSQRTSLKNGDAVVMSPRKETDSLLTAEKNECILLRIQLPKK